MVALKSGHVGETPAVDQGRAEWTHLTWMPRCRCVGGSQMLFETCDQFSHVMLRYFVVVCTRPLFIVLKEKEEESIRAFTCSTYEERFCGDGRLYGLPQVFKKSGCGQC